MTSLALGGLIAAIAGALLFQVHRAVSQLNNQSEAVRQAAREAERHYIGVLGRIIRCIEARDEYSAGRSERVGRLTEDIARKLGLPEDKCSQLGLAGRLHDIGLMAVPENVLNERARLNRDEFHTVQKHCDVAYEVLMPLESLREVLPAIRYHHERMNGTGYPAGRQGREIPLEARILAVADAYDAMTHDRPYQAAITAVDAMRELRRCSPAGYDPRCIDALTDALHLRDLEESLTAGAVSEKS
jgi:HD-GYP domain-containing protein (c-di-GMP phosphodiesterase class II)